MTQARSKPLTLQEFLELPETKPASEYIDGQVIQKPMPKGRHSRLQAKLYAAINQVAEGPKIAYAFPELRCSFAGRSLVPDVAVFQWDRIPFTPEGDVPDNFDLPPDWTIEILSPQQGPNKVLGNLLHCLEHGSRMGWFVDPDDLSILVLLPQQQPILCQGNQVLPAFLDLDLTLTVNQVFGLLNMGQ
jgi:Uma2 family endonuclease